MKRFFERGRWYSTVSRLTLANESLMKSHTRLRSRRWMRRTSITGISRLSRFLGLWPPRRLPPAAPFLRGTAAGFFTVRLALAMRASYVSGPGSGTDPGHQRLDLLHERVAVEALELGPGGERARVLDPVDEQLAVEVVDLVLERPG